MKPKYVFASLALMSILLLTVCSGATDPIVGQIQGPAAVIENTSVDYTVSVVDATGISCLWAVDPASAGTLDPVDEMTTTFTPDEVDADTQVTIRVTITTEGSDGSIVRSLEVTVIDQTIGVDCSYLAGVQDQYHETYDVYTDADSAGNHFVARGEMGTHAGQEVQPPMNERYNINTYSGIDCIECQFLSIGVNWCGWYFMNGMLEADETAPKPNWGTWDSCVDLTGASTLTFYARGAVGGEQVEFYTFGVGRDADTGDPVDEVEFPYYSSCERRTLGYVILGTEWQQYEINVASADKSGILGGFGWATNSDKNNDEDITFYLDEIKYDLPRLDEPRFLLSFKSINSSEDFDLVNRNVAFVYDNALALLAFMECGDDVRAGYIADALVYAQDHDRWFEDGRIRNAYQAGDLALFPGWLPNGKPDTVRMPGWYDMDDEHWYEDEFCVSTHTGNVAWGMIALLAFYEQNGGSEYLDAVVKMGEWLAYDPEWNVWANDMLGGFYGGWRDWEPDQEMLTYRSTEHNIDLYAAFERLYLITSETKWHDCAEHALLFVESMWNDTNGHFWTGTDPDSTDINMDVVPLDVQAWAILALQDETGDYWNGLQFIEDTMVYGSGYDFSYIPGAVGEPDGIWYEGTAQMSVVYQYTGDTSRAELITGFLESSLDISGGLYAANIDGLTTGFDLPLEEPTPWLYYHRLHVGATVWYLFADGGINPYWF